MPVSIRPLLVYLNSFGSDLLVSVLLSLLYLSLSLRFVCEERFSREIMVSSTTSTNSFLRSWAWKREHRPDKDRFDRPYIHAMLINGQHRKLTINQARYSSRGFASTVWDSAIVLSKYLEKWPVKVQGKRCVELGAGCGLPGIAAAWLGASSVLLTDLTENIPLLKENVQQNSVSDVVSVVPLEWGRRQDLLEIKTFDVVLAADVMYDVCVISDLIQTLQSIATPSTTIFLAYGRNRQAEERFSQEAVKWFTVDKVEAEELDDVYQCIDVDVFVLRKRSDLRANDVPCIDR